MKESPPEPRVRRPIFYIGASVLSLVLLLLLLLWAATTPYALRKIWLPMAAESAGIILQTDEIRLESLFPCRLKAFNLRYSDSAVSIKIRSAAVRLSPGKLKRRMVELCNVRLDGLHVICGTPPEKPKPVSKPAAKKRTAERPKPWTLTVQDFLLTDGTLKIQNRKGQITQTWTAGKVRGDRFQTGEICRIEAEEGTVVYQEKPNQLEIRRLPFRLKGVYCLDSKFELKNFNVRLETGICDLSLPGEIVIPAAAGINAAVHAEGTFPDAETLRIVRSEFRLFKEHVPIGNLRFQGTFDRTFQCEGTFSDLDMKHYFSTLSPGSEVELKVPHATFAATGSDFTQEGIRRDLKVRLIAELKNLSLPVELNQKNRLVRLIMIPVEAMPSLVELIQMKWNLHHKIDHGLETIKSIIAGKENLKFEQAKLDLALENGILKISDFTLRGKEILMESVQGKLDLGTEKLDIRTVLLINGVKLPLEFKGTLNEPAPRFREALKDFIVLNAPLLEKLEKLLTEPPNPKDSRLEKAVKRGYRELNRFLR